MVIPEDDLGEVCGGWPATHTAAMRFSTLVSDMLKSSPAAFLNQFSELSVCTTLGPELMTEEIEKDEKDQNSCPQAAHKQVNSFGIRVLNSNPRSLATYPCD